VSTLATRSSRSPSSFSETKAVRGAALSSSSSSTRRYRFRWQKGAKNHANTRPVGNVTQTAGYEPIAGAISGRPVVVTQPVTFSLSRKSRYAGGSVTVRVVRAPLANTLQLNGENRPFLPTEPTRGRYIFRAQIYGSGDHPGLSTETLRI
jgi:hypothetical protein